MCVCLPSVGTRLSVSNLTTSIFGALRFLKVVGGLRFSLRRSLRKRFGGPSLVEMAVELKPKTVDLDTISFKNYKIRWLNTREQCRRDLLILSQKINTREMTKSLTNRKNITQKYVTRVCKDVKFRITKSPETGLNSFYPILRASEERGLFLCSSSLRYRTSGKLERRLWDSLGSCRESGVVPEFL